MSSYLDSEELALENGNHQKIFFHSRFKFLMAHNGIRSGLIHILIGTSGSGKSSLVRPIIVDCAEVKKVAIWLSEETVRDYRIQLNNITRSKDTLDNITITSELDIPSGFKENIEKFMLYFEEHIFSLKPQIVFIDNLTTSFMYSDEIGPKGQNYVTDRLRKFSAKTGIPFFIVAHTKKGVFDNSNHLIELTDIRGSATLANTSPYAYILQNFRSNGQQYPILNIRKNRYHPISQNFFLLAFKNGAYIADGPIDFNTVNKHFQKRDKLGDKH